MHEQRLRDFFAGTASAQELAADLVGALVRESVDVTRHPIVDMNTDFEVTTAHLVKVCDAVLAGEIELESLQAIGFCLVASDHFSWDTDTPDGEMTAEVALDWSSPETNYPLTRENVIEWRKFLRGEPASLECAPRRGK